MILVQINNSNKYYSDANIFFNDLCFLNKIFNVLQAENYIKNVLKILECQQIFKGFFEGHEKILSTMNDSVTKQPISLA